ncbi:MAG: hypothetical protein M3151_13140, partial [Actinomycetota bacterium]|nr:hypothetical protein [Actinomycetota bacterium]
DLLREADRERLERELRRSRASHGKRPQKTRASTAGAAGRANVRLGVAEDAFRVAELLELRGMPRWVAFEERFIVAERNERIVAVLRFRQDFGRLNFGLLVTDPRVEEDPLAVGLYAGARTVARELGARELHTVTRR